MLEYTLMILLIPSPAPYPILKDVLPLSSGEVRVKLHSSQVETWQSA